MNLILTSLARAFCWVLIFLGAVGYALPRAAYSQESYGVPQFRLADPTKKTSEERPTQEVRFLADSDFPPFSYASGSGRPAGIAVELVQAICSDLRLTCRIILKPWDDLLPALERGEGEVVIAGPRLSPESLASADATRPFYRALGGFAVKNDSQLKTTDAEALAGKRIGAVKGSAHAAWLDRYYKSSDITLLDSPAAAHVTLQTGAIDALFEDAIQAIFWIQGQSSGKCCRLMDGSYNDSEYFSNAMVFLVRRGQRTLRDALDVGLDRMQTTGATADIFRRYVPASPW